MKTLLEKIIKKLYKEISADAELNSLFESLNEKIDLFEKIEECLYDTELYLVYKHTDPHGKVYIGITQNLPQTRWNEGGGYEKQTRFYKAIQKYGWINFQHEIIAAALSKEEALTLENETIIKYNAYDERYGYNTRVRLIKDEEIQQEKVNILHSKLRKSSDIEGQKFGKLTALRPTVERKGSSIVWECVCDCGNTVFVARSSLKNGTTKSCGCLRKEKKEKKNVVEYKKTGVSSISKEIVEKYSIKTINGEIFYLTEKGYVSEKETPFIEKILIMEYELTTRNRREAFKQIEILSRTNLTELSRDEKLQISSKENETIEAWMSNNGLSAKDLTSIATTRLYEMYYEWCKQTRNKHVLGKKQFFREISEKYDFIKKQKSDQKRYFEFRK